MTEWIIFDLGRVLVDFDFWKVVRRLKRYSPLSDKAIYHYFEKTPLWDAFERGRVSPRAFFRGLQRDLRLQGLSYEAFVPLWNDIFRKMPESIRVLDAARRRYKVALLSNVNPIHWEYIERRYAFMRWFDLPVASFQTGYRKPEPEIFRWTLRRARVEPSKAIFIDDVVDHVHGARAVGLRAHQFRSAAGLVKDLRGIL